MQKATLKPGKKRFRTAHARHYDGVSELVGAVKKSGKHMDDVVKKVMGMDAKFIGRDFKTTDEILAATNETDPAIMELMQKCKEKLMSKLPEPNVVKRVKRWDESEGDHFDLDRFRSGQQPWRRSRREHVSAARSITLSTNIGGNCDVASIDMMWTPAVAIALADLLENAGYSVKLIAGMYSREAYQNGHDGLTSVVLKKPDQPVNESALSTFASGWFFRSVFIGDIQNGEKDAGSPCTDTYGQMMPSVTGHCDINEIDLEAGPTCGFYQIPSVYTLSDALKYALIILAKIDADQQ